MLLLQRCSGAILRFSQAACVRNTSTLKHRLTILPIRSIFQGKVRYCNKAKLKPELKFDKDPHNLPKDVILYIVDNRRYFLCMNMFAVSQFIWWCYIGHIMKDMKSVDVSQIKSGSSLAWWRNFDFGHYSRQMCVMSYVIGFGVLSICWMHTLRAVRHIVLRKGGKTITIATHTPFGGHRYITRSIDEISAKTSRNESLGSSISLKVKGRVFHYLMDVESGKFIRPVLYDKTIGVRKNFASN